MLNSIKKFYTKAIRTTLLVQEMVSDKWYHLFSVIELQPGEAYPYHIPTEAWHDNCVRSNSKDYTFYLNIYYLDSVDNAINIFDNPIGKYEIDNNQINFYNSTFIREPTGDYPLVFPSNVSKSEGLSSILPKRNSGLLVWCQIDSDRAVENKFIQGSFSKNMGAIQQLTKDWLGFVLIQKSEHLGNIYLVLPNPYFRHINISLSTNPNGIFYKICWRKNMFQPLTFRVIDTHGETIAFDKTFEINEPCGLIELPHEPHLFELRIYNKENDFIALHEPATFTKTIIFNMSSKVADLHIKNGVEDIITEKYSKVNQSRIGETSNFNPEYYFQTAENKRKYIEQEKNNIFNFFPGAETEDEKTQWRDKAKQIIRGILNNAQDSCYICDPYFNSKDIVNFAMQIQNIGVKIKIINSKKFIKKDEAKKIVELLAEYNKLPFSKIEVRMLRGNSILHDRFIITDTNVWFIGSSFNEFGKRATCIAKVPESSNVQIIKEIEKWFSKPEYSEDINDYAKENSDE